MSSIASVRRLAMVGVALSCVTLSMTARAADTNFLNNLDTSLKAAEPESYSRTATIQIPGNPLTAFDISAVDPTLPLYYLADRSNASLDVIDVRTNTVAAQIGGFAGVQLTSGVANNNISGPDGVAVTGVGEVYVGDGDSTVKVVDLFNQKVVQVISTALPGQSVADAQRADEMAYDPQDHILVVANNAASPPFITFISTLPNNRHVLGHLIYNQSLGVEASVYDPSTGLFYINLTQFASNPNAGAVSIVNPRLQSEVGEIPVTGCNGAGIALGPKNHLLVGCSDTAGSQIVNLKTGTLLANVVQISGSDEVYYNAGDEKFYLAARGNPANEGGPSLGVIDAVTDKFVTSIPITVSAHSVATDSKTNHIFVPFGPNPADPSCLNGCVVVYAGKEKPTSLEKTFESFISDLEH